MLEKAWIWTCPEVDGELLSFYLSQNEDQRAWKGALVKQSASHSSPISFALVREVSETAKYNPSVMLAALLTDLSKCIFKFWSKHLDKPSMHRIFLDHENYFQNMHQNPAGKHCDRPCAPSAGGAVHFSPYLPSLLSLRPPNTWGQDGPITSITRTVLAVLGIPTSM